MRCFLFYFLLLNVVLGFAQNKNKVYEYSEITKQLDKSKIYHLEFHGFFHNIKELPKDLHEFKNLKSLSVYYQNDLTDLQPISKLLKLEKLSLTSCANLIDLKGVFTLKNLRSLDISDCGSLILPRKIKKLKQLERLTLSGIKNPKNIRVLKQLKKLKSLNLGIYDLNTIPKAISNIESLQKINVTGSNITNYESFKYLSQIDTLLYNRSNFDTIPETFRYLSNLKYLDLYNSKNLTSLSNLKYTKQLEFLNLSSCNLVEIPIAFKELKRLKHLDISSNLKLGHQDALIHIKGLDALESLNVMHTNTSYIKPEILALKNIKILKIGGNLQDFSDLKQLTNLTHLELQENSYTGHYIPNEILQLSKLKSLNFFNSKNLKDFDGIEKLADLEALNLSFCAFESVPKQFGKLKKLKKLELSFNQNLENYNYLKELTALEELRIQFCGLKKIPKEVYTLKKLKTLHFDFYTDAIDYDAFDTFQYLQEIHINYLDDKDQSAIEILKKRYPNIKINSYNREP